MDVLEYFDHNNFEESLILEVSYDKSLHEFSIIVDYAHDVVDAVMKKIDPPLYMNGKQYHRDLRKLLFTKVVMKQESSGIYDMKLFDKIFYHLLDFDYSMSITYIDIELKDSRFGIVIKTDRSTQYDFSFYDMQVSQKLVRAEREGDIFKYFDVYTEIPVDFYNPFKENIDQ